MKLYSLPNEILPSLSSALLLAWIPTLILQNAWWEIGILVFSFGTQSTLRHYLIEEILPEMSGTIRKLVWSEFWKRVWDYLLQPFPYNILVPHPTRMGSFPNDELANQNELQNPFQKIVSYLSRFCWPTKRIVSRIDKWTASSMKSLFQKKVQSSVAGLSEHLSWNSIFSASASSMSHEDLTRMIENEEARGRSPTGEEREQNQNEDPGENAEEVEMVTAETDTIEEELPILLEEEKLAADESLRESVTEEHTKSDEEATTTEVLEQKQDQDEVSDDNRDFNLST